MSENFQFNLDAITPFFQGGVRKIFILVAIVMLVLLFPAYYGGGLIANLLNNSPTNPNRFVQKNIVTPKVSVAKPVQITNSQKVDLIDGRSILYAFIDNSENIEVGFDPFVYRQQILDRNGQIVDDRVASTYLLPGGQQYVIQTVNSNQATEIRINQEPQTELKAYNPNDTGIFKRPNIEVRNPRFSAVDDQNLTLAATLKNVDKFFINRIDVVFLLRDNRGAVVGLAETNVRGVVPDKERDVRIDLPKPLNRTPTDVEVVWQVNYLQQDNIRLE